MGLLLAFVKSGGSGTTNDGNSARRALSDSIRKRFVSILGLENWLLDDLRTILITISCGHTINPVEFGRFTKSVMKKYVMKYPWYYMPPTIHKLLMHGQAVIEASSLPVGMLSEKAGESRNKLYQSFREQHARKPDRTKTMLNVFNRSLDSYDPIISHLNLSRRVCKEKKDPLPNAVVSLLLKYDANPAASENETEQLKHESELEIDISDFQLGTEVSNEDDVFFKSNCNI